MKKLKLLLKITGVVATLFVLGLSIAIYRLLPSASEIKGHFQIQTSHKGTSTEKSETSDSAATQAGALNDTLTQQTPSAEEAKGSLPSSQTQFKSSNSIFLFSLGRAIKVIDEKAWENTQYCDELKRQPKPIESTTDLEKLLATEGEDALSRHPSWMVLNLHHRDLFLGSSAKDLARQILDADPNAEGNPISGIADKILFYKNVLGAIDETAQRKTQIQETSRQAYILYLSAKIAQKRPEALSNPKFNDLCKMAEQFTKGEAADTVKLAEIEELMRELSIAPSEIAYDPKLSEATIEASRKGPLVKLTLDVPWVDKVLVINK